MRKLAIALTTALLGAGACKETTDSTRPEDKMTKPIEGITEPVPKPMDHDVPSTAKEEPSTAEQEFVQTRDQYAARTRARLEKIDDKLAELRQSADVRAKQAAAELRTRRDQLARRLDTVGMQAKRGWDQFETDLSRTFGELERDIDSAFK